MAATSGAQDFKERGNTAFKSGKFEEAESLYTAAIQAWGSADAKHLLHGNRCVHGDLPGCVCAAGAGMQSSTPGLHDQSSE